MIKLKESAGDIKLCKFIYVMTKEMVDGNPDHYIEPLKGYVYALSYDYNLLYPDTDSVPEHNEIVNSIPEAVWNARTEYIRGTIDYWNNEIQLTIDFPEQFFKREVFILRKMFDKFIKQRIPRTA